MDARRRLRGVRGIFDGDFSLEDGFGVEEDFAFYLERAAAFERRGAGGEGGFELIDHLVVVEFDLGRDCAQLGGGGDGSVGADVVGVAAQGEQVGGGLH